MPDEFSDEDLSMVQSMMKSNIDDRRNPYAVVPPQIVGAGGRGEGVMISQPSSRLPADLQQMIAEGASQIARQEMADPSTARPVVTRPVEPKLVQAMAAALRPDLAQFRRPGNRKPDYTTTTLPEPGEDEIVNPDGTITKG